MSTIATEFAAGMPEIVSVHGKPLADWIASLQTENPDVIEKAIQSLAGAAVAVDLGHIDWVVAADCGETPKGHLLHSFSCFCEQVLL